MIARSIMIILTTWAKRSGRFLFLLVSSALWLFMPVPLTFAQDISISADSMEQKGSVQILRGSVRIERDDLSITAESAKYEEATGDSYVEGNVYYEDADITIRASRAQLNLKDNTGILYDGEIYFKEGGYRILGKEIQKTGKDRYILKRALATTCDSVSPAWCFASRDADVLVGERLKAKHATFRVKGMPLFYTPYFWAPIVTERRTGFLTPSLGYQNETGLFYRQPFFWAISENRDATLFLDLFSLGSFGQGVEYRYIERPGFNGKLNAYHLRDESIGHDYYETKFIHRHPGRRFSGFADINNVNRIDFYRRYEPYLKTSATRYLESRAEVSAFVGNSRAYVLGQNYQDLKEDVDQKTVLQKLPETGLFIAPLAFGPITVTGSSSYANFQREEGTDGRRFDTSLKAANTIGRKITLTQTIGASKYYYRLNDLEADADIADNNADAPVEVSYDNESIDYTATLQAGIGRGFGGIHHEVVPSISYSSVTHTGDDIPGSVFFDSKESIVEVSQMKLSLMNRFMDNKGEFLSFRITQPYDFIREREDNKPFLPLVLNMALVRPLSLTLGMTYDTYEKHTTTLNSRVSYGLPRITVSVGHTYQRTAAYLPAIKIYNLDTNLRVTSAISMGTRATYDEEEARLKELTVGINYFRQCWGLSMEVAERDVMVDEEYQKERWVFFKMSLLGVSSFGFSVREAESWSMREG